MRRTSIESSGSDGGPIADVQQVRGCLDQSSPMPEHTIAVAPDEFELMLTAFAAHHLPILTECAAPSFEANSPNR